MVKIRVSWDVTQAKVIMSNCQEILIRKKSEKRRDQKSLLLQKLWKENTWVNQKFAIFW